jgi:hypothetical protein
LLGIVTPEADRDKRPRRRSNRTRSLAAFR